MTEQNAQQKPDLGPELGLTLHLAEINYVLSVLAKAPYEQVEGLIMKIRIQAQMALQTQSAPSIPETPEE